jgi:hypothetical protein
MSPFFKPTWNATAPVLVTLLTMLSVLVPLLHLGEGIDRALESEHHAATCVRGHDHSVCTQFGFNPPVPSDPPRRGTVSHEAVTLGPSVDQLFAPQDLHASHPSRAPPRRLNVPGNPT